MIKIKRKRKKNPYLVDYGYHFTNSTNIPSIIKNGLIPGLRNNRDSLWYDWLSPCQKKLLGYFYDNKSPLYFSDILDLRNLPASLIQHFNNNDYNRCLKVNVSKLNQLPDLFMLLIDYKCTCTSDDNGDYALNMYNLKYKKIKSLNNLLEKYDHIVPFNVLKTNESLQSELIMFTGTFVIVEKISSKYIEKVNIINRQ